MQKRRLGQTGLVVSELGLGTVKFGRNHGVKYPTAFQLPSDKEIETLLHLASELGINLLDTAPAYGVSEERLGKLLFNRHDWILASKAGEEFIDGDSHFDFSAQAITTSVERSLKRLQTDYLDLLLIHSNGQDEKIIQQDQVFSVLDKLKSAGKIRAFGMSTKTISGGLLTIQHADVAMVTYHPGYTDEHEIIRKAAETQKGILIKKAFASGHLEKLGQTTDPIQTALNFILAEPGVSSIILGTINPKHLLQNVGKVTP